MHDAPFEKADKVSLYLSMFRAGRQVTITFPL